MMESKELARIFENQGAALSVIEEARSFSASDGQHFINLMDESPYSIQDWLEALQLFSEWESSHQRTLPLGHKLEYISCCTQGGTSTQFLSLPFLLGEYLRDHGVE